MNLKKIITSSVFLTICFLRFGVYGTSAQQASIKRLYLPISPHTNLVRENGKEKLLINNYLNSNTMEIDESGSRSVTYLPDGNQVSGDITSDKLFTSHRKLENLSVYHAGARFYSPTVGQFIQPDLKEGPNRYAYVGNNPISFIDPDGNSQSNTIIQNLKRTIEGVFSFGAWAVASPLHPTVNEDATFIRPDLGIMSVFDGMGGHAGGNVASGIARQTMRARIEDVLGSNASTNEMLLGLLREIDVNIAQEARNNPSLHDMGTTGVIGAFRPTEGGGWKFSYAHAGDSRAYLVRGQQLYPLTLDHSLLGLYPDRHADLQWQFQNTGVYDRLSPEDRALFDRRNVIAVSLGGGHGMGFSSGGTVVLPGDSIALLSDGIVDNLTNRELLSLLLNINASDPWAGLRELTGSAYSNSLNQNRVHSKPDDITAQIGIYK